MADIEIPITCPECGAGMSAVTCYACGWDASLGVEEAGGEALGVDDSPATDRGRPAVPAEHYQEAVRRQSVPSAPAIRSGATRIPERGGPISFFFILLLWGVEWAISAAVLVALFRPALLAPYIGELDLHLDRLAPYGGANALAGFAVGSALVALFLLFRQRWAWVLALLAGAAWVAIAYFLNQGEPVERLLASLAPGGVALVLALLSARAPGARPVPAAPRTVSRPGNPVARAPAPRR